MFGDEIYSQADRFGACIVAVENNKFDATIQRLRDRGYDNLYVREEKPTRVGVPTRVRQWGWNTNAMTKSKALAELKQAVADGHLELSDPDLIEELKSYTRDDLMDREADPRLTTRHFDLLVSCFIAFQMRDYVEVKSEKLEKLEPEPYIPASRYEIPIEERVSKIKDVPGLLPGNIYEEI
ncbi:MAG: hypothetical protein DDT22_00788 [candidate division WS2 bacterium]|nr:hypothetical protein [Candidatus Lithacetigena glycinireducens]